MALVAICLGWTFSQRAIEKSRIRIALAELFALVPFCIPLFTWSLFYTTEWIRESSLLKELCSPFFRTYPFATLHLQQPPLNSYPLLIYMLSGLLFFAAVLVESYHAWLALFLILAGGIFSGVETLFIIDRMNTTFKFFNATWIILVLASVSALGIYLRSAKKLKPALSSLGVTGILGLAFISGGLNIFAMITHYRVPGFRPTLDGTAFLKIQKRANAKIIDYLNTHISGTPTLLEAQGHSYGEYGRMVMYTGIPSFIGWEHHVRQRGLPQKELVRRTGLVRTIYSSNDAEQAHRLLQKDNIELVIVGEIENRTYPAPGLKKFFNHPELFEELYSDGRNAVFRVESN